jgi:flagellar motility protein MotE (MotC chaperone)
MTRARTYRCEAARGAPVAAAVRATVLMALALTSIVAVGVAGAEDSWTPVVVTSVPPPDLVPADDVAPVRARGKRVLKETGSIPRAPALAPAPVAVPAAPSWDGLPPLATVAARTAVAPERPREAAEAPDGDIRLAKEYCLNIADPAADARFAWQKKVLVELEQQVAKRVELLEAKTAEYQKWLARRDEFSKKAQETVVTIYSRMRPDAAAAQLVAMDEETAAAVLTRLDPKNASAILNEMEPSQAARLTATISGASNVDLAGKSKPRPGDKRS